MEETKKALETAETKKVLAEAAIIGATFVASAGVGYLAGTAIVKMVEAGWKGVKLIGGIAAVSAGTCIACEGISNVAVAACEKVEANYMEERHQIVVEAALTAVNKTPKKGIWANGPKKSNAHLYV